MDAQPGKLGDNGISVAFRLETLEAQPDDTDSAAWKIEYLLQAREDPSLVNLC